MFGHRWEPAEATIVLSHAKKTTGDGLVTINEYVVDVSPTGGQVFRATVQEPTIATNFWPPSVGEVVGVLVDAKSGKVKFDKDDPRTDAKQRRADRNRHFEAVAQDAPAGSRFPGLGGTGGLGGLRVVVPESSGDPAERLAKLEKLRASGLLTDTEYETARARILDSI